MAARVGRSVRGGGHALLSPALVLIVVSTFALSGTASFADGGGDLHQDVPIESGGDPDSELEPESDPEAELEPEPDSEPDATDETLTEEDESLGSAESEDDTGPDVPEAPAPSEDSEDSEDSDDSEESDGVEGSGTSDDTAPEPDGEGDDSDGPEDEVADDVDSGDDAEQEIGPDEGSDDGSDTPTDDADDTNDTDDTNGTDESGAESEPVLLGVMIDESSMPLTVTLSGPDVVFLVVADGTIPEDAPLAPQQSGQTLNFSNATSCPAVISIVHGQDLDLGPYALRIRYLADPEATDAPTVVLAGVRDENALIPFLHLAAEGEGHAGFEKPLEFRLFSAHEGSLPESTTRFSPGDSMTISMRFVIESADCEA